MTLEEIKNCLAEVFLLLLLLLLLERERELQKKCYVFMKDNNTNLRIEEAGDIFEMSSNSASEYYFCQRTAQERMFYSRISKKIKIKFK